MRKIHSFNKKWSFRKGACQIPDTVPTDWYIVNIPHTWNAIDGQDGGNDYYRGRGIYVKELDKAALPKAERYYLEIGGANSSADIYINGELISRHDGGYSLFRVDITEKLSDKNIFCIIVDNSRNNTVYPQVADFTFYGGLYRSVNIICTNDSHFELDNLGSCGIKITPSVAGNNARVEVECWVSNMKKGQKIRYSISDRYNETLSALESESTRVDLFIENVRLWRGRKDPHLYTLTVDLLEGEDILDTVSDRFGCRSFQIDSERGFILNGEEYALRGVSRHQDRWGIGNALLPEHHKEDIELIYELGATAVRLAHYQHDKYFYDLCDEYGLIVWAEIPYISHHMPNGTENTVSQMKELIVQNYNHPSIVVWGLSNEITIHASDSPELIENHKLLNNLCHNMDPTRKTVVAAVSPCPTDSEYLKIPDAIAYNHYFGWYGGDVSMNGPWFDKFHTEHPEIPIGCSEYGCEALNWHTSSPVQGDYTEEYQSYYHEELIKQLFPRKYLWATYVWNMFDFGADARMEGGEYGQNHKGLVTFDRKYKKDAFYAYKAWLSDEPFVHLCGKRYIDRLEDVTRVTVYSNLDEVELFVNGKSVGKQHAPDHFFRFEVKNKGTTRLAAIAGDCMDGGIIRKVNSFNENYRMRDTGTLLNWFDITERDGYLSLNDKVSDIMATEEGAKVMAILFAKMRTDSTEGVEMSGGFRDMIGSLTLLRLTGMLGIMGLELDKPALLALNEKLNKIKKEVKSDIM